MKAISNTEYQKLRNKIWEDVVAAGVSSDEDENYIAFDNILGLHLNVDWNLDN